MLVIGLAHDDDVGVDVDAATENHSDLQALVFSSSAIGF